jgi:hypothetical protein
MLRFIKPGDIFCFEFDDRSYCFGRIIAETDFGHLAEIFDYISEEPYITIESKKNSRVMASIVLDSYSLFDKK